MNTCLSCGKDVKNKYCNVSCQNKHQNQSKTIKKYGEYIEFDVCCESCSKNFSVIEREFLHPQKDKYFCSRSCSNKRVVTAEHKQKTSSTLKSWYESHSKPKSVFSPKQEKTKTIKEKVVFEGKCEFCGETYLKRKKKQRFCGVICVRKKNRKNLLEFSSIGGRNSAKQQSSTRRSKNEIYFAELCKNHFNNIKTNATIFNGWDADVIIEDYKIAVLWNGKWHYEKITEAHSVKQVQNRDKIKISEIQKLNYEPYIIKDLGKFNKTFVENEFEKIKIYCGIQ